MRAQRGSSLLALSVILTFALYLGCGDDDDGNGPNGNTIVGSWTATSLTAPTQPVWGDGVVDDGLSVRITFNANSSYSWTVANDDPADPWICFDPPAASCNWTGTYSTSGNNIVFDQGTADEISGTYSISGNQMTMTFPVTAQIPDPYRYVLQKN